MFLKSTSGPIHIGQGHDDEMKKGCAEGSFMALTVWRKSLIVTCNGFTVIDSLGNLVFRVDNYKGRPKELILMDASGKSVLTMRRRPKRLRLVDSWLVHEGDDEEGSREPVWWVKKSIGVFNFGGSNNVLAHVYRGTSYERCAYVVQGSYAHRSCRVVDEAKRVVAEIRKKDDVAGGVSFGLEVFLLIVCAGIDAGFAMALVLLLDQMFS